MPNIDDILRLIDIELKRRGWFRTDLAEALGRSDAWLSKIMNKKRGISIQALLDIANALNVDPASLLPGGNPVELPTFEDYIKSIIDEHMEDKARKICKEEREKYSKNKKGD